MLALALLLLMQGEPLGRPVPPCFTEDFSGGIRSLRYIGDRACVDFTAPRQISGVWINEFEGSSFYEGARDRADAAERRHRVWLTLDKRSVVPEDFEPKQGHAYRLTFIGRTARDMDRKPLHGYGHVGMSPGLVLVDRILAWEPLGPAEVRYTE